MVVVLLLPKEARATIRWTSLAITILQVILAVIIFARFDRTLAGVNVASGMQFVERATWIDIKSVAWFGRVHIEYLLGIDGLSVAMVLLTALISFIATVSSWSIEKSLKKTILGNVGNILENTLQKIGDQGVVKTKEDLEGKIKKIKDLFKY